MAQHISIRVPWHDSMWNGNVCSSPESNQACLRLDGISESKNPDEELQFACQFIGSCSAPCIKENGAFMSDKDIIVTSIHPYSTWSDYHKHLLPTQEAFPAFSCIATPYKWLMKHMDRDYSKDVAADLAVTRGFDYSSEIEPIYDTPKIWVQHGKNQKSIMDSFFSDVVPGESLCIFYAKEVPFVDDSRRVVVGIGHAKKVHAPQQYDNTDSKKMPSYLWENVIEHTVRKDMQDGFLLPYDQFMHYAENHDDFDIKTVTAFVENEYFNEFSFKTEHVSHDAVIDIILKLIDVINVAKDCKLEGNWDHCLKWLNNELFKVWEDRGAFPGLGPMLQTMLIDNGVMVARAINDISKNSRKDFWSIVNDVLKNPKKTLPSAIAKGINTKVVQYWDMINSKPEMARYFKLLSRLTITKSQSDFFFTDPQVRKHIPEFLQNPYALYEFSLDLADNLKISFESIDKAVFPNSSVAERSPLPKGMKMISPYDDRRVRALILKVLGKTSEEGHTLLPLELLCERINNLRLEPVCNITEDILQLGEAFIKDKVIIKQDRDDVPYYKLKKYDRIDSLIQQHVTMRLNGTIELKEPVDWEEELNKKWGEPDSEIEQRARIEKAAALDVMARSRISVFIGGAGTGKTSVLEILCSVPEIKKGEVLLLAPTGKARVRMQQGLSNAYTIAQFLRANAYYNPTTHYYSTVQLETPKYPIEVPMTVIVDESSMIDEDMMGALIAATKRAKRIIFVGDSNQLPPIGAGRPFVDLISYIESINNPKIFPYATDNYARLTVPRRQKGSAGQIRSDLRLSSIFTDSKSEENEILFDIDELCQDGTVHFMKWNSYEELDEMLLSVIDKTIGGNGENSNEAFMSSFGSVTNPKDHVTVDKAEAWQILSPVRNNQIGINTINQTLHERYRRNNIKSAINYKQQNSNYPQPFGSNRIIWGDKVMNNTNQILRGIKWTGKDWDNQYNAVANGEIGIVTGIGRSSHLNVEFKSQPDWYYDFMKKNKDDSSESLELAYALTIHKAQGSQFNSVILILTDKTRMMSKELLYTALTRQEDDLYILYDKDLYELNKYTKPFYSEIKRRYTDLFFTPLIKKTQDRYYEERLIHKTSDGELVRSKSEVVVYNALNRVKHDYDIIDFEYEHKFQFPDGNVLLPDFFIVNVMTDKEYIWEHLGLPGDKSYMARWARKEEIYKANGYSREKGNLIVTMDGLDGSIDSQAIETLAESISQMQ